MPVTQSSVANAAPAAPTLKPFQYAAHHRPGHDYSPIHLGLDLAFKYFYSKTNLEKIVLEKGWLDEFSVHRLNNAIADVWAKVVFLKVSAQIPYRVGFCRFISKRDFLEQAIARATEQGSALSAYDCKRKLGEILVDSASGSGVYRLELTEHGCECECKAYLGLKSAIAEDDYLLKLLNSHPVLQGQLPDKHVFALWKIWDASDYRSYLIKFREWQRQNRSQQNYKEKLKICGISLRQDIPGHYDVWSKKQMLGSVDKRFDSEENSWWINQRQISMRAKVPGDHIHYGTPEEAAIALAEICHCINEGDKAKSDLFGGGWDAPTEASPYFIDDINQEAPQLVAAGANKKGQHDPFGGFSF